MPPAAGRLGAAMVSTGWLYSSTIESRTPETARKCCDATISAWVSS